MLRAAPILAEAEGRLWSDAEDPGEHAWTAGKVENLRVAVMGCIVNGPGESKHADIGISLPGTGEAPAAPVYIDGEKALTLRGEGIAAEFHQLVEDYIERRFGASTPAH